MVQARLHTVLWCLQGGQSPAVTVERGQGRGGLGCAASLQGQRLSVWPSFDDRREEYQLWRRKAACA